MASESARLKGPALAGLAEDAALMVGVRRQLHAHPERGFGETRTAAMIAGLLMEWGYEVVRHVGGTGVVASLTTGQGRTIGLRAELDGLPLHETGSVPYASVTEGVMHACGHDGHMAMLLAAARYLARSRCFSGTIRLVFQPAEEGLGGAARMLQDGLLDRFPCDAMFALHNAPDQRAGTVATRSGIMAAFGDWQQISIFCDGGHAACAGTGTDAVVIAASLVMALQTIAASHADPFEPAIVHIGSIYAGGRGRAHADGAAGVAAEFARLQVTVRTLSEPCRIRILAAIERIARAHVTGYGGQIEILPGCSYPPLINTPDETRLVVEVAREVVGDSNVFPPKNVRPIMASDDFGVFLQQCPGCYFLFGTQGVEPMRLHSSTYDFNDDCLQTGSALLTRLVQKMLPETA